ncbi:hypothetical protein [Parasitella parasitica]|uniref:Arrestin-like N-terminal domain-containing protein n=1 Tax=Parasitella parasitica TaxID=35722 RepID=A0A0B7NVR4_9FUNG|nr:hypothetical protein [Parasitella parasitica]
MKITSPTNDQSVRAGEKILIKYVMQPLVFKGTSNGYAKSLKINFHKRTGDQKQGFLENIYPSCPVTAQNDKYKAHSYYWTVPEGTAPGSYAFDFVEVVQLRRQQMTVEETVKVNVVD